MENKMTRGKKRITWMLALLWLVSVICGADILNAEAAVNGSFHLVGVGPGDAELLTSRALDVIRGADIVFCNAKKQEKLSALVDFKGKQVLDGYNVLFRYYGKDCAQVPADKKSWHGMTCEEFHKKQAEFAKLVRQAVKEGKHVAMLSSGDPTIYGPDIWAVKELHDLDPVVVPGLSAFNAANAVLKVSLGEVILTAPFKHKDSKDTLEKLTGHDRATLVIFMPRDMKELFTRLSAVHPADMPAAIVSNAGMAGREKMVRGTVGGLAANLPDMDFRRSIVYVGKALEHAQFEAKPSPENAGKGKFYLVGLGPGDPDIATLKALKIIESADLIFVHKRLGKKFEKYLAGKNVIHGYHRLFPFYGKKCADVTPKDQARERMSCEEYHKKQAEFAAIARKAVAEGKTVAMLDSGDPLVYGPCSWSLTELNDLNTEVVPGVSCFNAANAALRAGVTEGKNSHSVILASGWSVEEMAAHQSTMVLFTMRTDFKKFIDGLSKHYPADTPVAIVFKAGYAKEEKVMHGNLGTILSDMSKDKLPFEYLLYVGDFLNHSADRLKN
ncbi:SAM-dependent methyltransferase [Desulfonema magnum]|nr:SAM-dependent methyltransferase [Desulfonema magnum]